MREGQTDGQTDRETPMENRAAKKEKEWEGREAITVEEACRCVWGGELPDTPYILD